MEGMPSFGAALEAFISQPMLPSRARQRDKLRAALVSTIDRALPEPVRSISGVGLFIDVGALWQTAYPDGAGPLPGALRRRSLIVDSRGHMEVVSASGVSQWSSLDTALSRYTSGQLDAFRGVSVTIAPFVNMDTGSMQRSIGNNLSDQLRRGPVARWREIPRFLQYAGISEPHHWAARMLAYAVAGHVGQAMAHQKMVPEQQGQPSATEYLESQTQAGKPLLHCFDSLVAATAIAAGESAAVARYQRNFNTLADYCCAVHHPTRFDVELLTSLIVWSTKTAHEPAGSRLTIAPETLDQPGCQLILQAPDQIFSDGETSPLAGRIEHRINRLGKQALQLRPPGSVPTLTFGQPIDSLVL